MKNEVFRKIANIIFYVILIFFLFVSVVIVKAKIKNEQPEIFGYKFYIVLTGSMSPEIEISDMVVVKETDIEKLTEGDIITFRSQASGNTITHRINHINEKNEIITKGDANNSIDHGVVKEEQIVGKVTLSIPRIGYIFQFIQNNLKIILIVVVMIVVTASIVNKIKKYNTKLL